MAYPEATVDATINKAMDESFVEEMQSFKQVQFLNTKSAGALSNLTDNIFVQMTQLYQATASQLLQTNKLAGDILAQRSAMNHPQQAPSVIEPVVVKAP